MSFLKKVRFGISLLFDLILSPFQKKKVTEFLNSILSGDGDLLTKELDKLKCSQPGVYETVVEERDKWLGWKVCQIVDGLSNSPDSEEEDVAVLVVVGKGHVEGVEGMVRRRYGLGGGGEIREGEGREDIVKIAGRVYGEGITEKDAGWEGWVDHIVEVRV
ncbi:hypothetical protein TrCOL_g13353 [Triparma columacea]|uniref:Uncharacterized protein n=1 Tax=Triparma columacea TaxID=722753 RepID=A0A9W7LGU9_9STRA|nr:hypothetical protein TrCOL_g13353 [Triparma columacea]